MHIYHSRDASLEVIATVVVYFMCTFFFETYKSPADDDPRHQFYVRIFFLRDVTFVLLTRASPKAGGSRGER